jgi:fructose-bisphosphate aldolase class I
VTIQQLARQLIAPPKGILAADESTPTITKRLAAVGVPSTESSRRRYRELLLTTPDIDRYLSGVILFDETLRQRSSAGVSFPHLLAERGILPGIKIDQGLEPLPSSPNETLTRGLDGLEDRLRDHADLGARFTKWRATFTIRATDALPSNGCITQNVDRLAHSAQLAQQAGLVPIIEPEVLTDGNHSIEQSAEVTQTVLTALFEALGRTSVELDGLILKPNMVTAGADARSPAPVDEVARRTVTVLQSAVPRSVAGIVFLSGGQSPTLACEHLAAISRLPHPWPISFSFGRALQAEALAAWRGDDANRLAAQAAFTRRTALVSLAAAGAYSPELE